MCTTHTQTAELSVTFSGDPGHPVVVVAGEIDLSTADQLRSALDAVLADSDRVEIDLSGTTFMDSTGLAVLIAAFRRLGESREALVLRDPSRAVIRLLEVSGVGQLVDVRGVGTEALQRPTA